MPRGESVARERKAGGLSSTQATRRWLPGRASTAGRRAGSAAPESADPAQCPRRGIEGLSWARPARIERSATLATAGVLVAAVSGLPAWAVGRAYLTHLWGAIPLGGTSMPVSTVLLFDLGVYLCVWGALGGYALALIDVDGDPDERLSDDVETSR